MRVARMQRGINHHGRRQAAMKITSKLNTINAPVNIDTSFFIFSAGNIHPTCPKSQDTPLKFNFLYEIYFSLKYSNTAPSSTSSINESYSS